MGVGLYLILGVISIICFYFLHSFYKFSVRQNKLKWLPTVPGWPILGAILEFGDNTRTLHDLDRLIKGYGKIVIVNFLFHTNIITTDYDFVEYVLGTQEVLAKSDDYKYLHKWLGTGLLTSDGPKWKKRRRMTTPAFHFSILEQFIEVFEQNSDILMSELTKQADGETIDIYPFINRFALDVICETAMGVPVHAQKNKESRYVKNVKEMCRITLDRAFSLLKKSDVLYMLYPDYYNEKKIVNELHSVTNSVIEARKRELLLKGKDYTDDTNGVGKKKRLAFLDILLQSTIDGEPLSREDIREEVDTFMFEGHDTVSSAMSFALYLLAMHPEVQKRAVEEQKYIFEDDIHRRSTYKDLQEMKYLELIIKESLRLYPSVPMFSRMTTEDVRYKGNKIPKGVNIAILSYSILRDPNNFKDPEKFDPERFASNDGTRPYSYVPFSAGPRNCIGQKFAMLELKSTLSKVLRNFELLPPSSDFKIILVSEAVLKSKNGIQIKLSKRAWPT